MDKEMQLQSITTMFNDAMSSGNYGTYVKNTPRGFYGLASSTPVDDIGTSALNRFIDEYLTTGGNEIDRGKIGLAGEYTGPMSILAYIYCAVKGLVPWPSTIKFADMVKVGSEVYRVMTQTAKTYLPEGASQSVLDSVIGKDSYLQNGVFLPIYAALKEASESAGGKYSDDLVSLSWYVVGAILNTLRRTVRSQKDIPSEVDTIKKLFSPGSSGIRAFQDPELGSDMTIIPVDKSEINTKTHLAPIKLEFLLAQMDGSTLKYTSKGGVDVTGKVLKALLTDIAESSVGQQYIHPSVLNKIIRECQHTCIWMPTRLGKSSRMRLLR